MNVNQKLERKDMTNLNMVAVILVLVILFLGVAMYLFNNSSSEVEGLAEEYLIHRVANTYGEKVAEVTEVSIDNIEERTSAETDEKILYDVEATLTHPNLQKDTDESVTEHVYFYVRYEKLTETWGYGQVHPDDGY